MTTGQTKPIIAGGAESGPARRSQPRALFFSVLALLWAFPSVGALCILIPGLWNWGQAPGWRAVLRDVAFEHWIALGVLLLHPVFVLLAMRFRKTEQPREIELDGPALPDLGRPADQESKT